MFGIDREDSGITRAFLLRGLCLLLLASSGGVAQAQGVGSADPAWTVPSTAGASQSWGSLATQPDGKVLTVGTDVRNPQLTAVFRFDESGRPDPSFSQDGVAFIATNLPAPWVAGNITLDAYGRIYVGGPYLSTGESGFALARLLPDGAPDSSFGTNGIVQLATQRASAPQPYIATLFDEVFGFHFRLQPDGKVVVIATGQDKDAPRRTILVARLQTNGQLDTSFGTGGLTLIRLDVYGYAFGLGVASDGTLIIGGSQNSSSNSSPRRSFVMKLSAEGNVDSNFGTNGKVFLDNDATYYIEVNSLILQPDDRILLAGSRSLFAWQPGPAYAQDAVVIGLNPDGTYAAGFGEGGVSVIDLGDFGPEIANLLAFEPGGKILVFADVGWDMGPEADYANPHLLRLLANGQPDGSFAPVDVPGRGVNGLAAGTGAYALTREFYDEDRYYFRIFKYVTDPWPRSGSLNTGQTPSVSGFHVAMRNMQGTQVDNAALAHVVGIDGYIFPQSTDTGASANVYVVVATPRGVYMRTAAGNFVPWNQQFSSLVPAYSDVALTSMTHVPIHAGQLPFAGPYYFYLGYSRDGGPLIYSDEATALEVSQ